MRYNYTPWYHRLYMFITSPFYHQSHSITITSPMYHHYNPYITMIYIYICIYIYIWLVVSTPLKNMKVSWDDDILNIWTVIKAMFQTTNQIWYGGGLQPLTHIMVIMIMVIWYHGAIKWWYHITIIMKYQHDMGLNYNWENHYITMIYIYIYNYIYILYMI